MHKIAKLAHWTIKIVFQSTVIVCSVYENLQLWCYVLWCSGIVYRYGNTNDSSNFFTGMMIFLVDTALRLEFSSHWNEIFIHWHFYIALKNKKISCYVHQFQSINIVIISRMTTHTSSDFRLHWQCAAILPAELRSALHQSRVPKVV